MTKTEIFEDIVSIVKNDASFCKDELGADADEYRKIITDTMDDEDFLYAVQSYLASFHVLGHLSFRKSGRGVLPFTVKRYNDELYVVAVANNSPLDIGDRITAVDGINVNEYGKQHETMLYGESESRQGFCWFNLLSFAKSLTAVHRGKIINIPVVLNADWPDEEKYSCRQLNEKTVYMRLADFADDTAISKMYKENDLLLRSCEYLIIDVRGNEGGNDSAYMPLFEFCLAENETISSLKKGIFDSGIEINYSIRNSDRRLEKFEKALEEEDLPVDTRALLSNFVQELKANRGKGFIPFGTEDAACDSVYVGRTLPKRVYLITDEECASSGDAFVNDISKCSKVTVIGRPTMGILDYSNCTVEVYDNYFLVYPTSRSLYLDNDVQMRLHGVPVDIHIPWTPEHCIRDLDLEAVLDLISDNK